MTLSAEDRLDILDLYGRYSARFDAGDAAGWAALFADDGSFEIVGAGRPYEGHDALEAFVRRRTERSPGIRHFVSNIAIEAAAGGALGEAACIVLRPDGTTLRMQNVGGYRDELVRVDGGWRFRRRVFTSWLEPQLLDAPIATA